MDAIELQRSGEFSVGAFAENSIGIDRGGPGHPAPALEDGLARPAAPQGARERNSVVIMTGPVVVPTLGAPDTANQTLGRFRTASSENWVSHGIAF